ncbi:MAG: AAA family ATPase [Labilithrix sp.]|nr:AAA family ATPase [Labilithrix sp.]
MPAVRALERLDVNVPVTLFVGENGSGKSTLLEALAAAAELPSLGTSDVGADITLAAQRRLASLLRLAWRPRSRQGFFLRAEDFFGFQRSQARIDARILREKNESLGIATEQSVATAGGMHVDEEYASRHINRYDARSHGESFLDLFSSRVKPRGLYLLDEPEAPLSPKRQLVLLSLLVGAASSGAQFVVATHSPILLAFPGARIFSFDDVPIREVAYSDLEHVAVMRDFLNDPDATRGGSARLAARELVQAKEGPGGKVATQGSVRREFGMIQAMPEAMVLT